MDLAISIVYLVLGLYVLGLWIYLLGQTGLNFCWFFIVTGAIGTLLSVINTFYWYDPSAGIVFDITIVRYHAAELRLFACVRVANYVVAVIGTTFWVVWIRKAHESLSHPKA